MAKKIKKKLQEITGSVKLGDMLKNMKLFSPKKKPAKKKD